MVVASPSAPVHCLTLARRDRELDVRLERASWAEAVGALGVLDLQLPDRRAGQHYLALLAGGARGGL